MVVWEYAIEELRVFVESDLRWLRHCGFGALDMPMASRGVSR